MSGTSGRPRIPLGAATPYVSQELPVRLYPSTQPGRRRVSYENIASPTRGATRRIQMSYRSSPTCADSARSKRPLASDEMLDTMGQNQSSSASRVGRRIPLRSCRASYFASRHQVPRAPSSRRHTDVSGLLAPLLVLLLEPETLQVPARSPVALRSVALQLEFGSGSPVQLWSTTTTHIRSYVDRLQIKVQVAQLNCLSSSCQHVGMVIHPDLARNPVHNR